MRLAWMVLAAALLCASHTSAQTADTGGQAPTSPTPTAAESEEPVEWSFAAAAYIYLVPEDSNYAQPTVTADRDWLHFEARFNYEDLDTGSLWAGYNFGGGSTVAWELTPMLGGVFGNIAAVAPGYRGLVSWRKLEFSSEGEYVFGARDEEERFFYNWSELTVAPLEWWRIGLVTQRTRAYAAERDIQRGLLVGFTFRNVDSTLYLFNPDDSKPITVVAVTVGF